MARRKGKARSWRLYAAALMALALIVAVAWYWWAMRDWSPSEEEFPDQGVALAMGQTDVSYPTIGALGGKFAYFAIGPLGAPRDSKLTDAIAAAKAAGLQAGVQLSFDPCAKADRQSARFVTMVPRDAGLLPPAIALGRSADNCRETVSDAAVESELMTLINQVEMHAEKPVILKVSRQFEERHKVSRAFARDLWLVGDRFVPRYASRPWLLWSANGTRHIETSGEPVEWVVVQP